MRTIIVMSILWLPGGCDAPQQDCAAVRSASARPTVGAAEASSTPASAVEDEPEPAEDSSDESADDCDDELDDAGADAKGIIDSIGR